MMAELAPEQPPPPGAAVDSNGLGLAAFIISLVGLFTAGILSLVGMIMGAVAMRREPRGFAIAGFVIGLVGSLLGCLIMAFVLGVVGVAGIGLTAGILSLVYAQIEDGVKAMDAASSVIVTWSDEHDGALPSDQAAQAALTAAGVDAVYRLIDSDEFELTLVVDKSSRDPWTFTAEYEADGDRQNLHWESESGSSHGNWGL